MTLPPARFAVLTELAERLFMRPQKFLDTFAEQPHQALAALRKAPETFGPLRTYTGKDWVEHARQQLTSEARRILAEETPRRP